MKKLFAFLLAVSAGSFACDEATSSVRPSPTSAAFVVTGGRVAPLVSALADGCLVGINPLVDLQLIVTASDSNVFVDNVALRMGDGTNLGGPMVTFAAPALSARFGSTLVSAGTSRGFGFPSTFACSPGRSVFAQALVALIDARGVRQTLTTDVTIR